MEMSIETTQKSDQSTDGMRRSLSTRILVVFGFSSR